MKEFLMQNLRIPGPTPCPEEVLDAMGWQMVNHRGPEFASLLTDVTEKLKRLIGVFGHRFAAIASQFGAQVIPLNFEWGKAAEVDAIRQALADNPKIKAVLVTHNETSTGVTNNLEAISALVKEFDKLLLVDAISSLGSIELPVDEWRCDVTVTGSQKGWMVPPGMAMVAVGQEAWEANSQATMPRFFFAFSVALDKMLAEGLDNIIARHARIARMTRDGIKELGLSLFAEESHASNTVTSVAASGGLDTKMLVKIMREEHGIVLGGGQQTMAGKIFRIGHLGWVNEDDIGQVLTALKIVLPQAGFKGGS
jgi:aspartate aminotransferase-like enzyme